LGDCVFCRIARHEAPAAIVFEDDDIIVHLHVHVMGGRRFTWPPG
jgi:diadenosine tetraphosphate (Ap4A) HIT family hydrolase